MGREFAYAYKSGARPAGQPRSDTNFRDASPRPAAVGPNNRNVTRVNDTAVTQKPIPEKVNKCSALTRSGDPCKGRPVTGSDLCVFHKE